jgi:hypothetical protein
MFEQREEACIVPSIMRDRSRNLIQSMGNLSQFFRPFTDVNELSLVLYWEHFHLLLRNQEAHPIYSAASIRSTTQALYATSVSTPC